MLEARLHTSLSNIYEDTPVQLEFDVELRSVHREIIFPQYGEEAVQVFASLSTSHLWDGSMGDNYWPVTIPAGK